MRPRQARSRRRPSAALRELGWTPEQAAAFVRARGRGLPAGPRRQQRRRGAGHDGRRPGGGRPPARHQPRRRERRGPARRGRLAGARAAVRDEPGRAVLRSVLPRRGTHRPRPRVRRPTAGPGHQPGPGLPRLRASTRTSTRGASSATCCWPSRPAVTPVVILNKVGHRGGPAARAVSEVHAVAPGTRVIVSSAITGAGLDEIRRHPRARPHGLPAGLVGRGQVEPRERPAGRGAPGRPCACARTTAVAATRPRAASSSRCPAAGCSSTRPGCARSASSGTRPRLDAVVRRRRHPRVCSAASATAATRASRAAPCGPPSRPGALSAGRLASHRKLEAELRSVALRADARSERAEGRRLGRLYRQHGKLVEPQQAGRGVRHPTPDAQPSGHRRSGAARPGTRAASAGSAPGRHQGRRRCCATRSSQGFSRPMLVCGPWPGRTVRPSSRVASRASESTMTARRHLRAGRCDPSRPRRACRR